MWAVIENSWWPQTSLKCRLFSCNFWVSPHLFWLSNCSYFGTHYIWRGCRLVRIHSVSILLIMRLPPMAHLKPSGSIGSEEGTGCLWGEWRGEIKVQVGFGGPPDGVSLGNSSISLIGDVEQWATWLMDHHSFLGSWWDVPSWPYDIHTMMMGC